MNINACKTYILYLAALLSVSKGQKIYSPNYPESYFNKIDCNYTISSDDPSQLVQLTMHDFSTEACCDHLEIEQHNDDSNVTRFSGKVSGLTFQLQTPVVLRFRTDHSVVSRGFLFSYSSVDTPSHTNFTCDRVCAPTFNGSDDRQCGLSKNTKGLLCYNPCQDAWFIYGGSTCPEYFTYINSTTSYLGHPYQTSTTAYQCYSQCQNRYYTSVNTTCSNQNANLCLNTEYANILPECSQATTPIVPASSPSMWNWCYNPCTERYIRQFGWECPKFYQYINSTTSYLGHPYHTSTTTYQCYSRCQNRYYTSVNTTCSNQNANLCLNTEYANILPECSQVPASSPSMWNWCYNPCTERYIRQFGWECPKFYQYFSVSNQYVGYPFYRNIPIYQCYSQCQNRYYTSNDANCSNSNANLCRNSDYAGTLSQCGASDRRSTSSPSRWLSCYSHCTEGYVSHFGLECPKPYRYISVSNQYVGYPFYRNIPVYRCYSQCQNRYYTSNYVNCSNSNANLCRNSDYARTLAECGESRAKPRLTCYNPCDKTNSVVNGYECPNYFRYVQSFNYHESGLVTHECFSHCQNQYYTTRGRYNNCSNSNANLCENSEYSNSRLCPRQWSKGSLTGQKVAIGVLTGVVFICAIVIAALAARNSKGGRRQGAPQSNSAVGVNNPVFSGVSSEETAARPPISTNMYPTVPTISANTPPPAYKLRSSTADAGHANGMASVA